MKFFNVIAILCSLFIVVNGQTNQQYTFTLSNSIGNMIVNLGDNSYEMSCDNTECTRSITSETSETTYYYSFSSYGQIINEYVHGKHPCIYAVYSNQMSGQLYTLRVLHNTNEDTFGAQPHCNLNNVQCDEFVYDNELGPDGLRYENCRSIPVDKISTLKDKLADSPLFNGNCEMST